MIQDSLINSPIEVTCGEDMQSENDSTHFDSEEEIEAIVSSSTLFSSPLSSDVTQKRFADGTGYISPTLLFRKLTEAGKAIGSASSESASSMCCIYLIHSFMYR